MLTPKFLESVSDPAVELWRQVEDDILRDMARRISTYDYDIPSAMYQRQRLEATGMLRKDVVKRLSQMTGKSQKEIRRLMQLAGQETVRTDQEIYTRAQIYKASKVNTAALNRAMNGGLIQTNGAMKNLCKTTATMAQKQFCNLLDRAWLQVSSGAFDIDSAVRNACKSLAASGIHAVQYSGRTMSLESAVRMIVRTGVNQTAAKLQLELAGEFETDLVQVTAHAGARPDHEVWQGKVFSISGKTNGYQKLSTATGYGTVEGLCGANCRHNFFPTWEGVDDVYPKELLEEYTRKDAYSYNGKKMSEYEATQVQRNIERNIRKWQREFITMEAAGKDTVEAGAKLKEWKSKERDFLRQTGLKGHDIQVVGFSRIQSDSIYEQVKAGIIEFPRYVTAEYLNAAKGRIKSISFEKGYKRGDRKNEIEAAGWIVEKFGGDITLLSETKENGVKRPDFSWNGRLWELKGISSKTSTDSQVRSALKQIKNNPGGILLDCKSSDMTKDEILNVISARMRRSSSGQTDVIVRYIDGTFSVFRYKK